MLTQRNAILLLLVKTAGQHHKIRSDIAAEASTLAGVNGFRNDVLAEIHNSGHGTAVHAHLEPVPAPVYQTKQSRNPLILRRKNIRPGAQSDRFMQQKDHTVDPFREIICFQPGYSFIDGVVPQDEVNIGFHSFVQQQLNRLKGVIIAVPAHRDRAAILLADRRQLLRQAVAGGRIVGHNVVLAANGKDLLKMLMLIGISPAAQGKLIHPSVALHGDFREIFQRHVGLVNCQPALITSDASFHAQSGFSMDAMPHDTQVNQMRERRHERIHAGIPAVFQDACADIGSGIGIEHGNEVVFLIDDFLH